MSIQAFIKSIFSSGSPGIKEFSLRLAEWIIPRGYFIQQQPDFTQSLVRFRGFPEAAGYYNHNGIVKTALRDGNRVLMAHLLLRYVEQLPAGDYAELGTYQGNFARIIFRYMAPTASLYCFDTFTGFSQSDVDAESTATGLEVPAGLFGDTSLAQVRRMISEKETDERLNLVQGIFPETYQGLEDRRWRFVNIDCDLYKPSKAALEVFWPRLVPGGLLLCHDYNHSFLGIKKAVDEFFSPLGIVPVPLCDKAGSCVIIKGWPAPSAENLPGT